MNVLVVAQYFPPDLGGAATRAFNIAKGLALNGCKVTVVAAFPHYPHGNIPAKYRWTPLKFERMGNLKIVRTLMPPIKSEGFFKRLLLVGFFAVSSLFVLPFVGKIDAVWASSWIPGVVYGRIKRSPVALNVDDLTVEDLPDLDLISKDSIVMKIAERIYRFWYVKGDIITPHSPAYARIITGKYCVKPDRIHLVRGGVDLSMFQQAIPKLPRSRKQFTVTYSGAFSVAYDFEQIFKAAKLVEKLDSDVKFVIQGQGELLNNMRTRVNELNLKNVKILNKLLTRAEVGGLLGQADVLILPLAKFKKPYKGISSKLYEYQAVGKPIICCSRGMPKFYVQESQSGLVVYPGDYEALAKAILELKKNPLLAQTLGRNGRNYVESEGSLEAIGSTMKRIFEPLIFA